jgi:RES domain-containing protein
VIRPLALVALKIKTKRLLDLTNKAIRRRIGFRVDELVQEDWSGIQDAGLESWTQAIGRGCRVAGFEGLIVPSASTQSGKNLVVFPDKLLSGSYIRIMGNKELPPHPSLWPK